MPVKVIVKPAKAAPALGPYNHGVRAGDFLFCAGQIPIDPAHPNGPLLADIRAQTERVLENVKIILEDQKLSLANVVKATVSVVGGSWSDRAGRRTGRLERSPPGRDRTCRSQGQVAAFGI